MNEFNKDMLLVVDEPLAESYAGGTMIDDCLLHNVDIVSLPMLEKVRPKFIDVSGVPIDWEKGVPIDLKNGIKKAYIRAKYFDEPNVYYEATFDSINRMNRERFNMFKRVAHMLGATMITKMNVQEEESSYGTAMHFGAGFAQSSEENKELGGKIKAPVKKIDIEAGAGKSGGNTEEIERSINVEIQSLIAQKLDRSFLQYEVFEAQEFDQVRWNSAKKILEDNGLLYCEDFRNLLESRNPEYGLKKFDFMQYQISSDLNKYLTLAAAIDFSGLFANAASGIISGGIGTAVSGGVAKVLSGIFGVEIGLNAKIKNQIQNFKRESDLLVMGFEHAESCLDELDKIIDQYKKTKNLLGDGRLEKQSVAIQLLDKGFLSLGEISTIAKLPVDEIQKLRERMDKKYQNQLEKNPKK